MDLNKLFELLQSFKCLPTYQFERRLDAFLLLYLEKAFNERYKKYATDFLFLYPEFPLWPKIIGVMELDKSAKRSVYADYVMYSRKKKLLLFVEMKTDDKSVGQNQVDTYVLNQQQGWETLFRDLIDKTIHSCKNNGSWRKYCCAINFIYQKAPELTGLTEPPNLQQFYEKEKGQGVSKHLKNLQAKLKFQILPTIGLVYLAPTGAMNKVLITCADKIKPEDILFRLNHFADFTDEPLKTLLKKIDP